MRHRLIRELLAHFTRQTGYDGPQRVYLSRGRAAVTV